MRKNAITCFKDFNNYVTPCGVIIDEVMPILADTPDGLVRFDSAIEIKCPSSCSELMPEERIVYRKVTFWKVHKDNFFF